MRGTLRSVVLGSPLRPDSDTFCTSLFLLAQGVTAHGAALANGKARVPAVFCESGYFVAVAIVLQTLYEISSIHVPDARLDSVSNESSTTIVCSVAFSRSCNELAIGQSDGLVRIWQLPLKFELQHLCRLVINGLVPPAQVTHLPLPRNLKAYLLFSPLASTRVNECS